MIFTIDLTIPKNTSSSSPYKEPLIISSGLIYRVEFQFPPGCAGLAGLVVADGGFQIWPSTPGKWFVTDNYVIAFDDLYEKEQPPFVLDFWGYNLDETYDHTIYCRIGIADKQIYKARFLPNVAYELMTEELNKAEAEREALKEDFLSSPFPWIKKE